MSNSPKGWRDDSPIRWWQFSRKRHCPHVNLRGIYGDEINHTPGYRRNECLDCGRLLDGPVSIARDRDNQTPADKLVP